MIIHERCKAQTGPEIEIPSIANADSAPTCPGEVVGEANAQFGFGEQPDCFGMWDPSGRTELPVPRASVSVRA